MAAPLKYLPNPAITEALSGLPDAREQLIKSLTTIVVGSPPKKPWTDAFKSDPQGLWTGPTSIAYVFFGLSETHPDLVIEGKVPIDWCYAYLDCGSDTHPVAGNGIGVKNEYMAFNTVRAIATKDLAYVENLKAAAAAANLEAPAVENEYLSGRAGTLALLRIVRHWIPAASEGLNQVMEPLIKHCLEHQPWTFRDVAYIGAAHGSIGIITQIVLCNPSYAPALETPLIEHLDAQREDGNWFVRAALPDPTNLMQFCHGAPGFVLSLIKLRPYFPKLHARIDKAIKAARERIWEQGILKKEPNLCHGVTGNALALESPQREHFMSYGTAERIQAGIEDGTYIKTDDTYGLQWGEAGRAWAWMAFDTNDVEGKGWPAYTDI
ncbi:abscisic acid ABA receptor [Phlyctema vagabunda]|uniref:Abscisic acid ABA receptor n=1 Tax=Phlyctema vagabunda TaxID=108571 RepID=A0ABR4PMF6_9HELO